MTTRLKKMVANVHTNKYIIIHSFMLQSVQFLPVKLMPRGGDAPVLTSSHHTSFEHDRGGVLHALACSLIEHEPDPLFSAPHVSLVAPSQLRDRLRAAAAAAATRQQCAPRGTTTPHLFTQIDAATATYTTGKRAQPVHIQHATSWCGVPCAAASELAAEHCPLPSPRT